MPGTVPSIAAASWIRRGGATRRARTTTAATRAAVATSTRIIRTMRPRRRCARSDARGGLERGSLVGPLPRELGLGAAEVAEGRGLLVDRPAQVELLHDP